MAVRGGRIQENGAVARWTPQAHPTKIIPGRLVTLPSGKVVERWANQTDSGQNRLGPSEDRWKERSETYTGVSEAMAAQWGGKAL